MKQQVDKLRTDRIFQVGEMVLLKLQQYVQHSVVFRSCPKLSFRYFGPFKIVKCIGSVAYELELPEGASIQLVFHVSRLNPFTPNYRPVFSELPTTLNLEQGALRLVKILDRRLVKKGNHAIS